VSAAVSSTKRAWLAGESDPVVVADVRGTDVQIAWVTRGIAIARWVPASQLGRAISVEAAVSHAPGGPPDQMLYVLPGFPVPATTGPWVHITSPAPLRFDGFIPNGATTTIFEAPPERTELRTSLAFSVRTDPRDDAPVRGTLEAGGRVRVSGTAPAPWVAITAWGTFARATGYIRPPDPSPARTDEGSEIVEDAAIAWLPIGTCLRDAPNGKIVGAVIGTLRDKPTPHPGGGTEIKVGNVTYYANEAVVEVPPDEQVPWMFGS